MEENRSQEVLLQESFRQTRLHQILTERAAGDARVRKIAAVVDHILEPAEDVLRAGATSPLDFTLHDNRHSFRVAELMMTVLPPSMPPNLSGEELALLLLSAYLHDIGMTPPKELILKYRDLIVGGDHRLEESAKQDLYSWFDSSDFADSIQLPLSLSNPTALDQLEQVLTYYIRAKHNDWGADWIDKHVEQFPLNKYPDFKDDLIRLCKSHHYGFDELARDDYNPKQVGAPGTPATVNLRYLACVLRVADILDFDPERTPTVIYQVRNIAAKSRIFWHQSFYINSSPSKDRKKWIFEAHPPNATFHQALTIVASDIEREFALCHRLQNVRPFSHSVAGDLPHTWDLPSELTVLITPKDNAYVFIEGAFRPNTRRLLHMLSGNSLYRSELDSIRELLQNAFDAVKELIAYEITRGLASATSRELTSDAMEVEIRLEQADGRFFISCADPGVGMTKNIIENYVLVSGNDRSKELRSLERTLEARGLSLGRTGTFGIGILSYFMIADQVTITTKRSELCNDEEGGGWVFETGGVGSFGELRRQNHRLRGTEVRLQLKHSFAGSVEQLESAVHSYLQRILVRLPCRVRFVGFKETTTWFTGWARRSDDFIESMFAPIFEKGADDPSAELLSMEGRAKRLQAAAVWHRTEGELRKALRWHILEGQLGGGLGVFRAHLPYFDLPGGTCLAFLQARREGARLLVDAIDRVDYIVPETHQIQGWKGMVSARTGIESGFFMLEIDWTSGNAGQISVDRSRLKPSDESAKVISTLQSDLRKEVHTFLSKHKSSVYESLNKRLVGVPSTSTDLHWLERVDEARYWAPIKFPSLSRKPVEREDWIEQTPLRSPEALRPYDRYSEYTWISWLPKGSDPDRVLPRTGSMYLDGTDRADP